MLGARLQGGSPGDVDGENGVPGTPERDRPLFGSSGENEWKRSLQGLLPAGRTGRPAMAQADKPEACAQSRSSPEAGIKTSEQDGSLFGKRDLIDDRLKHAGICSHLSRHRLTARSACNVRKRQTAEQTL